MPALLIAGLGNPGTQYEHTRHNLGARALHAWAGADLSARHPLVTLLYPETFMNDSGAAIKKALDFFKLTPSELIIVHDEAELPFGEVRSKEGGSAAGHNGVRSIIEHLNTDAFWRLRLGIGRPEGAMPLERYVLEAFTSAEEQQLPALFEKASAELTAMCSRPLPE